MYQWALEALDRFVDETVIVSHPSLTDRFKHNSTVAVYEDVEKFQGFGPLAGIYTAMVKSPAAWYYIIPCDTPLVTANVFRVLEEQLPKTCGVVPLVNGRLQPLISIYHRDLLPVIERLLTAGKLRMTDLIDQASIRKVNLSLEQQFININTKAELNSLEETMDN